jgi:DNA-binding NarL/FixJ family response regulator
MSYFERAVVRPASVAEFQLVESLTTRQQEVLVLMAKGQGVKETAQELFISPNTVKTHRKEIRRKLGASNAVEIVANAFHVELITAEDVAVNPERSLSKIDRLTVRQRDILQLLAKGLTNRAIADQLSISTNTVKSHVKSLTAAFEANSVEGVVFDLIQSGDLPLVEAVGNIDVGAFANAITPRRSQVLEALIRGGTNKQIANALQISPHTVKQHLSAMGSLDGISTRFHIGVAYMAVKEQGLMPGR